MMKKGISRILWQLCLVILATSIAYADFGLMLGSFRNRDNAEKYMIYTDRYGKVPFSKVKDVYNYDGKKTVKKTFLVDIFE